MCGTGCGGMSTSRLPSCSARLGQSGQVGDVSSGEAHFQPLRDGRRVRCSTFHQRGGMALAMIVGLMNPVGGQGNRGGAVARGDKPCSSGVGTTGEPAPGPLFFV